MNNSTNVASFSGLAQSSNQPGQFQSPQTGMSLGGMGMNKYVMIELTGYYLLNPLVWAEVSLVLTGNN